jgi:hypothetical protein
VEHDVDMAGPGGREGCLEAFEEPPHEGPYRIALVPVCVAHAPRLRVDVDVSRLVAFTEFR